MRNALKKFDIKLLIAPAILVIISLFTLYSIDVSFARQQIITTSTALFALVIFSQLDHTILKYFRIHMYLAIIIALIILLAIGPEVRGSVRWFDLFGVRLQVSEIIKPFFVIVLASYLSSLKNTSFVNFIKSYTLVSPIVVLILLQPDLGSAIIFLMVSTFMIIMRAFPIKYFLTLATLAVISSPILYSTLETYQKQRLLTFINITDDPSGTSYNAIQALISVGSGGLLGKGFGESTQSILHFLPERHTDFIFASISESLGFFGAAVIVAIYAFFLYRINSIAQSTTDTFNYLVASGFFSLFLIHVFFNIGMNVGLLPVVGITLPFLSFGGSAQLTNFITLGLLSSITSQTKKTVSTYEIN